MDLSGATFALLLVWYAVFLFSTTLHEASHALVAYKLGDPTAYHGGQVSLNPLPHIVREPLGMVAFPVISFLMIGFVFGWASAPYDPQWAARHPRRSGLMSLAGPTANLALVAVGWVLIRVGLAAGWFRPPEAITGLDTLTAGAGGPGTAGLATFVSVLFSLNLILFLFNLLPLPPLDGSGVVQILLSEDTARRYQQLLAHPMLGLIGILIAWRLFSPLFRPLFRFALELLYPGVYG
ncbi:MAG TPA: site-2 protease family protein [Thermoanaerobaculia bacterium]|nr:site-2 protease family protein [Thermoanaerobaculia bacterium]